MGARKIGAVIALDGEKQFKSAVTSVNKELTSLKAQLGLTKEQFDGQANSLKALQAKHEVLNKVLDAHKKKVEETKKGLSNAQDSYEKVGNGVKELQTRLEEAKKKMEDMKKSSDSSKSALSAQQKEIDELSAAIKKGENNYTTAGNRVKDWETKLNTAETQVIRANKALDKNAQYMKEAENSADHCATSIDQYGKLVKKSTEITAEFGEKLESAFANKLVTDGIDKLKEMGGYVASGILEADSAASQLEASMDVSTASMEKYKDVMNEIYAGNYGDNFDDVAGTISKVTQNMGEMDPSKLKDISENAITLRDTFDMDLDESIRGINGLITNMGTDSQEAFDLVAKGAQNGLNRSGELVENLAEYSQLWGQAGFSAEEMFSILQNGLDSGAYNLDKVNDFVKEFGNSLADGRIEQQLDSFSTGTQNLFYQVKNGQASTKDLFQSVIADLASMENQQEALTIASETWSALGEDNAMKVITSLNNVNNTYADVHGTMEKIREVKYDNLSSQITQIGREIQIKLAEKLEKLLPVIKNVAEFAEDHLDVLISGALGLGAAVSAWKFSKMSFWKDIISGLLRMTTSIEGASAAQGILNAVMNMNPIARVVAVVGVAVGAFAAFYSILKDTKDENDRLAESSDKLKRETDDLLESQKNTAQKYEDTTSELAAQGEVADDIAGKLFSLSKEYQTTGEGMGVMKSYVDQLNTIMPGLNLTIDEETGALNKNAEEIYASIDALNAYAQAKAAQERLVEITKEQIDAEIKLAEMQDENSDAGKAAAKYDEYIKKQKELNKQLEDGTINGQYYEAQFEKLNLTYDAYNLEKVINQNQKQEDSLEKQIEGFDKEREVLSDVCEENLKLSDGIAQTTEALEGSGDAFTATTDAATAATEQMKEVVAEYQQQVADTIESQVDLFDEFEKQEAVSTEKVISNMQQNVAALEEWSSNVQAAGNRASRGFAEEIDKGLLQKLIDMGPEGAATLAAFVNATDEQVQAANEAYRRSLDLESSTAEEAANAVYEIENSGIPEAAGKVGEKATKAEASGLQSGGGEVAEAAKNVKDLTVNELIKLTDDAKACGVKGMDALSMSIATGAVSASDAAGKLNASIQNRFSELSQKAAVSGISIPENISSGIQAGGGSAVSALQALAGLLEQNGIDAGEKFNTGTAQGMKNTESNTSTAAQDVVLSARNQVSGSIRSFYNQGRELALALSRGIRSGTSNAAGAATDVAASAYAGASQYDFSNIGYNMSAGIARGIYAGKSMTVEAAGNVAASAVAAAKSAAAIQSPSRKMRDEVGVMLSRGMAEGITDGRRDVVSSITEVCKGVLVAAQDELEIQSPSKKFRNLVGKQISRGVAFGITDNVKGVKKSAEWLSSQVYQAASKWMTNYRKSHKTSLDDIDYYWREVLKKTKYGTEAYTKVWDRIEENHLWGKIDSKFGVKRGTGKDRKSDKDYYSEIFQAARQYLDNYSITYDISLNQQKWYWETVIKKLKAGSQAWYDAKGQLQSVNAQILQSKQDTITELASVQDKALDGYKTYYKVSAKAEMDYWNICRKQFKTGTAERIEADQKYFEARESYYDQLTERQQQFKDDAKEINDQLKDDIKDLEDAYKDAVTERKNDIVSSFGLFEKFQSESDSGAVLLHNLKTQVAGIADWEQQLEELGGKNILSEGLLEELRNMGPEASASIHALNTLTKEQLKEYNDLWNQKNDLAESQAVKELEPMRQETITQIQGLRKDAKEELKKLTDEFNQEVASLSAGMSNALKYLAEHAKTTGEEAISNLVMNISKKASTAETKSAIKKATASLTDGFKDLPKAGEIIGGDTLQGILDGLTDSKKIETSAKGFVEGLKAAIQDAAEIHSPSRVFKRAIGIPIAEGIGEGIKEGAQIADRSAAEMITRLVENAKTQIAGQQSAIAEFQHNLNTSGIYAANRLMEMPTGQVSAVTGNSGTGLLQEMIALMRDYFPYLAEEKQIVFDADSASAALQPGISREMASAIRRRR
ncbi:phage tail tape measure protein [Ruminococcus sp. OA3]|uniref:phage tail tape measure protein n=1 Tax=Ruminococcus sp. OA3 TaxID=2914164 RepID=UPI001F05B8F9|nr:phage tail tape measure protein [Ruminococcus sp. OA3]MCH1984548.1 phage tail tape measure protein [Ruminococcus sp. OA3]